MTERNWNVKQNKVRILNITIGVPVLFFQDSAPRLGLNRIEYLPFFHSDQEGPRSDNKGRLKEAYIKLAESPEENKLQIFLSCSFLYI